MAEEPIPSAMVHQAKHDFSLHDDELLAFSLQKTVAEVTALRENIEKGGALSEECMHVAQLFADISRHYIEIETRLVINGMGLEEVTPDSNSYFTATCKMLQDIYPELSANLLRKAALNHIKKYEDQYAIHLGDTNLDDAVRDMENGILNTDLGVAIPHAVSNMLQTDIIIHTSVQGKPQYHIKPTMNLIIDDDQSDDNDSFSFVSDKEIPTLQYALVVLSGGYAHYDFCTYLAGSKDANGKAGNNEKEGKKESDHIKSKSCKRNEQKLMVNQGKGHIKFDGTEAVARQVQSVDCKQCRFSCSSKFTKEMRENIHSSFWSTGTIERQRDYIAMHITEVEIKRRYENVSNPREVSREYTLPNPSGERIRVCKKFFLKTLDISDKRVTTAMNKKTIGGPTTSDRRGKNKPWNKTPCDDRQYILNHINSFPVVESHYCRKHSSKRYLSSSLSVVKMYDLYKEKALNENRKPVTSFIYRRFFEQCNLSFQKPLKDKCGICHLREKEKISQTKYHEHIERKKQMRAEKERDKKEAKENNNIYSATFDMQQILQIPSSNVGATYYMHKLNLYNLFIFGLGESDGTCYVWSEFEGKRGSIEVGTALLNHLKSLPENVDKVVLYSDTCAGQNRNRFITGLLKYIVQTEEKFKTIEQKFFETGHSFMEADAIHATIERKKKHTSLEVPRDLYVMMNVARKQPYRVVPLGNQSFIDVKRIATQVFGNPKKYAEGGKIEWLKIKHLRVVREGPKVNVYFRYDMKENLRLIPEGRLTRQGDIVSKLHLAYDTFLPISEEKKKDLLKMIEMGIISEENKSFYMNIPSVDKIRASACDGECGNLEE